MRTFLKTAAFVNCTFIILISTMTHAYAVDPQHALHKKMLEKALSQLSLPSQAISAADLSEIQTTIRQALEVTSSYIGARSRWKKKMKVLNLKEMNNQVPLIEGLLSLEKWLRQQGCVHYLNSALRGSSGKYAVARLFISHPAKISIGINFQIKDKGIQRYNLVLLDKSSSIHFASLTKAR